MIQDNFHIPSINGFIIIVAAAIGGLLMSTSPSKPQKVVAVQAPDISIHDAARGNIEAIKQHIAAGTDVNAKGENVNKVAPLHIAAYQGQKEIIELLIANGADVNFKDINSSTPLHWAVLHVQPKIVELLIANGADVNANGGRGIGTPLHCAINAKKSEIADLLRKHGGKTPEELKVEGN